MRRLLLVVSALAAVGACGDSVPPLATAKPGVVFTYPIDGQNDVPVGARIVVTFSDPVTKAAIGPCTATTGAFCIVGPAGPVDAMPTVSDDGLSVSYEGGLEPGTKYQLFARSDLAPTAENLPTPGPLLSFTTRASRPRSAAPTLVSVNGGDPTKIGTSFRPMFETTTLRLLFSEPLDPRSIRMGAGYFELLNSAGSAVTANIISDGIHVSIDPKDDLTAGSSYVLRLGNQVADLGGQTLATTTLMFSPTQSRTGMPLVHSMKPADAKTFKSRSGAEPNVIVINKPLIGRETSTMLPFTLNAEIGDPTILPDKAIGFTIRRGQRLASTGMNIKLGGQIPSGLETGDVEIELLTDASGRLYRNPYQPAEQRPENERAPVYVDLSMDIAVYAKDPTGNAVLTQTVLGMQATGTAIETDGQLIIETVSSMELGLLGVTQAPTNLVLVLATKGPGDAPPADTEPPTLVASTPGQSEEAAVDSGVDLVFSEPIDLERARAGIRLEDAVTNAPVETILESHGASVVLRPVVPLPYAGHNFRVVMSDVADVAGNKATIPNLSFNVPALASTGVPASVVAIHPGAPCVLTGATAASPGRCDGGKTGDDLFHPFTLAANDPIQVTFSEPLRRTSVTRNTACGQAGSFKIEEVDGAGNCTAVVPGTLILGDRTVTFIADEPWSAAKKYKLTLNSGGNATCDAGELCDPGGAMSFDPLNGMKSGDSGGNALVVPFTGAPLSGGTFLVTSAGPFTDLNGSGTIDSVEGKVTENRAKMRITNVTGFAGATFTGNTCDAQPVNNKEGCMYLLGAMPVDMGEVSTTCPLPGGGTAASCVPVTMSPQVMFATSLTMAADTGTIIGTINTDTNTSVMRIREPLGGAPMGYIVDNGGAPKMVAQLELYMDAPDMSVTLSSHDLHSKPLTVSLEGPLTFLPNGKIAITLANTADMTVDVAISGPISGHVTMIIPKGEMHLQLVSPAPRGVSL